MTVDMKGLPVDFDAFKELSSETGIPFISDSAESYGSIYKGNLVGSQANAHSFSFFANKNITTGEGGAILTNNITYDNKAKLIRSHGIVRNKSKHWEYKMNILGYNFRLPDINCALGISQLSKLSKFVKKSQHIEIKVLTAQS